MGPHPKNGVLTRREKSGHEGTQKEEGVKGGRDGSCTGTGREVPGWQPPPEPKGGSRKASPRGHQSKDGPADTLISDF